MKRGKKLSKEFATILLLFAIALGFSLIWQSQRTDLVADSWNDFACIDDACFVIEIADTPQARQQGLMHRDYIGPEEGMLFIFDIEGIYPFWMKNTLIPLDMIWIDNEGTIVHIARNVQPCENDPCPSTNPGVSARYVLEVAAGRAESFTIGDHVTILLQRP